MAIKSLISKLEKDGKVKGIYCHYDGYLDGVGNTLKRYWCSEEKMDSLLKKGDIPYLATNLDELEPYEDTDYYNNIIEKYTTFENLDSIISYFKNNGFDYLYVFEDGKFKYLTKIGFKLKEF